MNRVGVTPENFEAIVQKLSAPGTRSLDCESTGLRVHHGDKLFAIIIGDENCQYYFNFLEYPTPTPCLPRSLLPKLQAVFEQPGSTWFIHNAKFDMHLLANENLFLGGRVHCTKVGAFLEYNEHMSYGLAACAERIGFKKDDAVEAYIKANKLSTQVAIPGKKVRARLKDFTAVPFDIMFPYGCTDADVGYRLGRHQEAAFGKLTDGTPGDLPRLQTVVENEQRLTKTVFRMERRGLRVRLDYCRDAADYESVRARELEEQFRAVTGEEYKASPKLFERLFESERPKWKLTKKGNPSFESDVLKTFDHAAAKIVCDLRDAKSKSDFYQSFLYHADADGNIHPSLNPDGGVHGRFSSSDPNGQNFTKADDKAKYTPRKAIVPRPGFFAVAMDYNQMEYLFLLDRAREEALAERIMKEGIDVHTATAKDAEVTRDVAKTVNFATIYMAGDKRLAESLKKTVGEAKAIRQKVLGAMPHVAKYMAGITETARKRGYIFNWLGRRCWFPDARFDYRALNYAIAGGCADVIKVAMNNIDSFLAGKKSRLLWNVHDELWFEIHESEEHIVPELKRLMETAYPHRIIPLTVNVEWSDKSFGEMEDWDPKPEPVTEKVTESVVAYTQNGVTQNLSGPDFSALMKESINNMMARMYAQMGLP